jgi:hypothetical protein
MLYAGSRQATDFFNEIIVSSGNNTGGDVYFYGQRAQAVDCLCGCCVLVIVVCWMVLVLDEEEGGSTMNHGGATFTIYHLVQRLSLTFLRTSRALAEL